MQEMFTKIQEEQKKIRTEMKNRLEGVKSKNNGRPKVTWKPE